MSQQEDDKLDKILKQVESINRGLYGDAVNKVPGLMQQHYELDAKVDKLQESEKKRTWMAGGVSLTFPLVVMWLKDKLGL